MHLVCTLPLECLYVEISPHHLAFTLVCSFVPSFLRVFQLSELFIESCFHIIFAREVFLCWKVDGAPPSSHLYTTEFEGGHCPTSISRSCPVAPVCFKMFSQNFSSIGYSVKDTYLTSVIKWKLLVYSIAAKLCLLRELVAISFNSVTGPSTETAKCKNW